jgi:hypothetical protein
MRKARRLPIALTAPALVSPSTDAVPMGVVGHGLGARDAAQEFVHEAKVALEEPEKRNFAAIELDRARVSGSAGTILPERARTYEPVNLSILALSDVSEINDLRYAKMSKTGKIHILYGWPF